MNRIKLIITLILLCTLTACGVAEFFIKRTVNGLQEKIADEFKTYADFSELQEREIDLFAEETAGWLRTARLPILVEHLQQAASDIEQAAVLSEATWRGFVLFMEDPMQLSKQPETIYRLADLAYSLSDQQTEQVLAKLNDEFAENLEEQQEQTIDDRHDKIIKGTKTIFKEIGIKRSSSQLEQARAMLDARYDYLDYDTATMQENQTRFLSVISERGADQLAYRDRFLSQWQLAETTPIEAMPEAWEKNFRISFSMMNYLLQDVTPEERVIAANKIREYAALFEELANPNQLN